MPPSSPNHAFDKIRRLNPHRDLNTVANLIEDSFQLQHDDEGQVILRQMRATAERLRFDTNLILLPGTPKGFVWEEDGRIVGNISLIQFSSHGKRVFLIANVAVDPAYRRLGIASALTRYTLRFIAQKPAAQVWLQVQRENSAAIHLYENLHFKFVYGFTRWKSPAARQLHTLMAGQVPAPFKLGRRKLTDWPAQSAYLEANYPADTRWYLNVDFKAFGPLAWLNPARWEGLTELSHLALHRSDALAGVLTWQRTDLSSDELWAALPAGPAEDLSMTLLLDRFIRKEAPQRPMSLDYPYGRAVNALEASGFTPGKNLNWMRYSPPE